MRISIVDDDINWRERVKAQILQYDKNKEMEIDMFPSGEKYLAKKTICSSMYKA